MPGRVQHGCHPQPPMSFLVSVPPGQNDNFPPYIPFLTLTLTLRMFAKKDTVVTFNAPS